MISYTNLQTQFGILSQNADSGNLALGAFLMNQEHRYLLQKYFSNEASYTITTIGSTNLTLTSAPQIGSTSATLTSSWAFANSQTWVTFSDGEQRYVTFINGSTSITWANALIGTNFTLTASVNAGSTSATLQSLWPNASGALLSQFSDGEQKTITYIANSNSISWTGGLTSTVTANVYVSVFTTTIGVGGVQTYNLPPDYSKLKTGTLTIGNLRWNPREILTRQEWDDLNVFPYYADIPNNYFIWNYQFNLWPIPSTTGNIIAFNYKRRIPDLSLADYTTGTLTATNGSNIITGASTIWIVTTNNTNESRYLQIPQPTGDNAWYQIATVNSTTSLTLTAPYQGTSVSGASYIIGQMPNLYEDFHDMLLYKALTYYFSSIVDNEGKKKEWEDAYDAKLKLLEEYCGTKSVDVNLGRSVTIRNPNSYPQNIG